MPLNVQLVNAQVKDPQSGQMTPAGLIGSDAISTINTAKNQAIAAVQQKGEETLQSIPDDYTALSNEVDDVKTQLSNFHSNGDIFPYNLVDPVNWTDKAYVNTFTGELVSSNGYFATGYIPVTAGKIYQSNKGRNNAWYDSTKTYISGEASAAIQNGITAPEDAAYIRFTVNKSTDGIDTPSLLYFTEKKLYTTTNTIPGLIDEKTNILNNYGDFEKSVKPDLINDKAARLSDGAIIDYTDWSITDYINLGLASKWKTSTTIQNNCYYDKDKNFISSLQNASSGNEYDIPEYACYLICSTGTNTLKAANITLIDKAVPDRLQEKVNREYSFGDNVVSDSTLLQKVIGVTKQPNNLVNPFECVDKYYVAYNSGALVRDSGYFATGFIPVTPETIYKSNKGRNHAWYDSSKTYISGEASAAIQNGITAPENAAYIRFTVNKSTDGISNPFNLYFAEKSLFSDTVTIPGLIADVAKPWCYGKKINWLGDSIVADADFDEQVTGTLGLIETDYGINGSTIAFDSNGGNTRNAICTRYADMTNDTDIIAISCGTNDWMYAWCPIGDIDDPDDGTVKNTFYGALKTLCKGLIDKYPQKLIFFTTPIKRAQAFANGDGGEYTADGIMTTPFSKNKYGKTLGDYANIIKEVCGYYSIPVLDMYNESLLNPSIPSQQNMFDNYYTHPTLTGQKIMARRVCGWLMQLGYNIS